MINVLKTLDKQGKNVVFIKTIDATIRIGVGEHESLYMSCLPIGDDQISGSCEIIITKDDYEIYQLFKELYDGIKSGKNQHGFRSWNDRYNYNFLINDGVIDWHSDDEQDSHFVTRKDPAYMEENRLVIKEIGDKISVSFHRGNNSKEVITVKIGGIFCKYHPFDFYFMNMYKKLVNYEFGEVEPNREKRR